MTTPAFGTLQHYLLLTDDLYEHRQNAPTQLLLVGWVFVYFQILSVLILTIYFKNIYFIIAYLVVYGIASPLNGLSYGVMVQNTIAKVDPEGEYRCELNCIKELWIGVGRISAILIIIILYYFEST